MAARENIRLSKPNFTTDGSFFYSIHETADVMFVKVDDGTVAFTYPLDTSPDQTIKELEWDGVFFWSLEDHDDGGVDGFVIRKWAIDDFVCKQVGIFSFIDDGTHTYRASSFAVEHYRSSIGEGNNDGSGNGYTGVNLQDEIFLYDTSRIAVGEILYFVKRWTPAHNRYGTTNIEQVLVNSIISSTKVELSSNTVVDSYGDGRGWRGKEADPSASEPIPPDELYWTKYLWVFNDYSPGPTSTPALYKINAYNGSLISQDSGTQYGDVNASTFYVKYTTDTNTDSPDHTESLTFNKAIVDDSEEGGNQTYVVFIKSSSGLFYNASTGATDRSIIVDNVKVDTINLWPVYDLAITGVEPDVTILRLQLGTTYKNSGGDLTDVSWSSVYSYDRTLLRRHVKSIAVTATPSIVPITTGQAAIVATCRDQYNDSLPAGVQVSFADDDSGVGEASVTPTTGTTDAFGRAYTTFFAGSTEKDVKITATSTWVDPS